MKTPPIFLALSGCFASLIGLAGLERDAWGTESSGRPNVIMLVVDDMNDWISLLDPNSPIKTPNLERLAEQGTLFTQAYCMSPACNPSRVATLTGLRPTTSGVYGNKSDWRRALPNRRTLMQQFQVAGYDVFGAGKIFHHQLEGAFHDDDSFDNFQPMRPQVYPDKKLNASPDYGSRNTDWGEFPVRKKDTIDFHTASYCVEFLSENPAEQDKPFFLACGIYKPHSPFFAPAEFHDRYQSIPLPLRKSDDWSDLPSGAVTLMKGKKWFWQGMEKVQRRQKSAYHDFIRSYAACVSFADAQIGRVLDALAGNPQHENTVVVLWSDHGFHLGEKDHIEKFALWEKSNHIPFIIVAPGTTSPGTQCHQPIDMSALYPTLLELCSIPAIDDCDGTSITPLLRDVTSKWDHPALMTYLPGNHAVRSNRWRYIQYADGTEELYDLKSDPNEWTNLAPQTESEPILQSHRQWLPSTEAQAASDMKAPL